VSRSQVAAFSRRLINSIRRASSAAVRSSGAPRFTFALRGEFFRRGIPILAKHTGPLTQGTRLSNRLYPPTRTPRVRRVNTKFVRPVMFPLGRARLSTNLLPIGSATRMKTTGMASVAFLA
jgi:hypothetical protein